MSRSGTTTSDRLRGGRKADPAPRRERGRSGGRPSDGAPPRPRSGGRPRPSSARVTSLEVRRRGGRLGRHRRPVLVLAGLLALAGLGALLWAGPVFAVREVRVDGLVTLPADQVRQAAGVERDLPLLQVDVAAAEARVAGLPQVAAVEVTRGWPSSVVITVVERAPLAVVEEAGRRTLIDGEGVLFDTISGAPPPGVVPLDVAEPGPGDPATVAGLAAIGTLPAEIRDRVANVAAGSGNDVTLLFADGTTVVWGTGDESVEKAGVLAALLQQIEAGAVEPANLIDVSAPDAVVLR